MGFKSNSQHFFCMGYSYKLKTFIKQELNILRTDTHGLLLKFKRCFVAEVMLRWTRRGSE